MFCLLELSMAKELGVELALRASPISILTVGHLL